MSDDRMKIDKNRIKAFSNQALDIAITRRVNFVQKHKKDFQSLEVELAQLWVAVEHCYQRKDWERLITFREALQPFLDLRGFWSHSLTLSQWAQEAAQAQGDIFGEARYIHEQANILSLQGNYREAETFYQNSETIYCTLGQDEWVLQNQQMRAIALRAQGRFSEAQQLCESTIDAAKKLKLWQWQAHPIYVLALLAQDQGNTQQAEALVETSLALLTGTNQYEKIGQCYDFLAEIALRLKKFDQARVHLEKARQLAQQTGIKR